MSCLVLRGRSLKVCLCSYRIVFPISVDSKSSGKSQPRRWSSTNQNESLISRGWRKLAIAVKTFMAGSKALYYDVREMYDIRSKHGKYLITKAAPRETTPGNVDFPLSRQQLQFSYNTRKSLIKMFPTVTLFFIPFFGYFVPLVAFMYPDKLLSHHFLNEEQREEFALSKARQSAAVFQGLLQDINGKLSEEQREILTNLNKEIPSGSSEGRKSMSSDFIPLKLTHNHPNLLCKAWGLKSWIPTNSRRQRLLTDHMYYLFTCDWLLTHEGGVDKLTDKQVVEACLERKIAYGTDASSVHDLKTQLQVWTSITTSFEECPISLMAHLPLSQYVSTLTKQ